MSFSGLSVMLNLFTLNDLCSRVWGKPTPPPGPFTALSKFVLYKVLSYINVEDQGACLLVCKKWNEVMTGRIGNPKGPLPKINALANEIAFNTMLRRNLIITTKTWNRYIGNVGDAPPLPENLPQILNSWCPFWPDKKVYETHLLTLIPRTVNGLPFTLNTLENLVKVPKEGNPMQYSFYWSDIKTAIGDRPIEQSYWVLMSKGVVPNSRFLYTSDQYAFASKYPGYSTPKVLEVTTSILMRYLISGAAKERILSDRPWHLTCCIERSQDHKFSVGGFAEDGPIIRSMALESSFDDSGCVGVVPLMRL